MIINKNQMDSNGDEKNKAKQNKAKQSRSTARAMRKKGQQR